MPLSTTRIFLRLAANRIAHDAIDNDPSKFNKA